MNADMKVIGDMFRQRRKEMNLNLKEVENATSIRTNYLQAIEDGQMEKLISPVYAQGFLKQYATFLGMDGDRIIKEHPEIFSRGVQQEFTYGIGTLEMRGNPGAGVKWVPNTFWFLAFLMMIALAWYMAKTLEVL